MLEFFLGTFLICLSKSFNTIVKLSILLADASLLMYIHYKEWSYHLSIPKCEKILIGFNEDETNKLLPILNAQEKYGYYFVGHKELNSQSLPYISNSVYYYHLKYENASNIPISVYNKFLLIPLFYQKSYENYFSSDKGFYIYLVGKYDSDLTKSAMSELPIGSAILLIGHQFNDKILAIIYSEIQLSFFKNDCGNIYINFIHTIILSPLSLTLMVKTDNNILVFEHNNFCPILTELSWKQYKIIQIEFFVEFFLSNIQSKLNEIQAVNDFTNYINERLLDKISITNLIDEIDNSKQYETMMLYNCIISNYLEPIENLLKVSTTNINEMIINHIPVIHLAIEYSELNIIKLLISYGLDFETKDENNHTPFIVAIKNQKHEVVQYFYNELDICIKIKDFEKVSDKSLSEKLLEYTCSPLLLGNIENLVDDVF